MREIVGSIHDEFTSERWDAICCTTNTIVGTNGLIMGAGVALAFKQRYHFLPTTWGNAVAQWPLPRTFVIATIIAYEADRRLRYAVAFPTKRDYRQPSELSLIKRSALQLQIVIEALGWKEVLLPRPGCANGGLRWKDVQPVLQPIFDDRVTIISRS